MPDLSDLCDDLEAEHEDLDGIVSRLRDEDWDTSTPAEGWSVRDQISHLAFFDEQAELSCRDPETFLATSIPAIVSDPKAFMEGPLLEGRQKEPREILQWWRKARSDLLETFRRVEPGSRLGWFGPPMSAASFISARLMETWAHGQDIVDAVAVPRPPTARLKHVAHLGVRARRFSYETNGMTLPSSDVRVVLEAPGGGTWTWGDGETDVVEGPALDFCLVVAQRRHPEDTDLKVRGEAAKEWISIAQVFAGPPGAGRRPGQFPRSTAGARDVAAPGS